MKREIEVTETVTVMTRKEVEFELRAGSKNDDLEVRRNDGDFRLVAKLTPIGLALRENIPTGFGLPIDELGQIVILRKEPAPQDETPTPRDETPTPREKPGAKEWRALREQIYRAAEILNRERWPQTASDLRFAANAYIKAAGLE